MYKILAIDDDSTIRKLIHKILAGEGYESVIVGTAAEGLKACAEAKPDLVLLDVHLPDGNGIELCAAIKGDEKTSHIPVLLMSGEAVSVENRVDGMESGAEDYIVKPFMPQELVSRMGGILKVSSRPTRA